MSCKVVSAYVLRWQHRIKFVLWNVECIAIVMFSLIDFIFRDPLSTSLASVMVLKAMFWTASSLVQWYSLTRAVYKNRKTIIKYTTIITYGGTLLALFIKRHHWLRLEAIQTICIRLITESLIYVRNEVFRNTCNFEPIESIIRSQSQSFFTKNIYSTHQRIIELGRSQSPD